MRVRAVCLGLGLLAAGCPGPERDLDRTAPDVYVPPFDAKTELPPVEPVPVRVLTWNVRNLFNAVIDSPDISPAAEQEDMPTPAQYEGKLAAVAAVIQNLSPDICMLQEVENQNVLNDLAQKVGTYQFRHVSQGRDPRGIDVAIMSRLPIDRIVSHVTDQFQSPATGQSYSFARDVLEAHFTVAGRQLRLFGVHLKAGVDPSDDDKRLAEATHLRALLMQHQTSDPASLLIVLGDFNSVPGSPPIQTLIGEPPDQLASATASLPPADRYSVTFFGNPRLFDDQLIDPEAAAVLDPASVRIQHGSEVNQASDHDPVVATYVVR